MTAHLITLAVALGLTAVLLTFYPPAIIAAALALTAWALFRIHAVRTGTTKGFRPQHLRVPRNSRDNLLCAPRQRQE